MRHPIGKDLARSFKQRTRRWQRISVGSCAGSRGPSALLSCRPWQGSGITVDGIWCCHCSTTGGNNIRGELGGEFPGSAVLHPQAVCRLLGSGTYVCLVHGAHATVFEDDTTIDKNSLHISPCFSVDEGVERVIEWPQEYRIGLQH